MLNISILDLIGHTPIVKLNKIVPHSSASIYVKLEYMNPGGSVKDRPALWMIRKAEEEGILKPGMEIIEVTSGNTGISLAMIGALKGYKVTCIIGYDVAPEKIKLLEIMGVNVVKLPQEWIRKDPNIAFEIAKRMAKEREAYYVNQHENPFNVDAHYQTTAREIWEQMRGQIDAFVAGVGTGGTLFGVAKYLKKMKPDIKIIAVEPKGSKLYKIFKNGMFDYPNEYKQSIIEGIGVRKISKIMDTKLIDNIIVVDDREAIETLIKLIRYEGILSGISGGANVYAALKVARKLGQGKNVVTVIPDNTFKYVNVVYEYLKEII